ncbi:hypothetical protein [Rugosimonospora africana]|uniref:Recombinase n=1 Tax=Rugosimonospora africana TaxID=556532 RepID=A0A8J3R7F3_9ACTN|nr:hypothetical protein [Rugosimonospora africana]GIH21411.1 hypothetical protein Raf01_95830 [Rugosimonospora africana]
MQGSWNNDKPHYRCVYPTECGLANHTQHPRSIYLREESIVPALDRWLLTAFSPTALPHTIQTLVDAQDDRQDDELLARTAEAKRIIADCDQRLARYRAALEAGTDPTLIARWTSEVNATRAAAQTQMRTASEGTTRMTAEEIGGLIAALGNIIAILSDADPADKAKIYSGIGLRLTYQPGQNKVIAEAKPSAIMYEGSCPRPDRYRDPTGARARQRDRVWRLRRMGFVSEGLHEPMPNGRQFCQHGCPQAHGSDTPRMAVAVASSPGSEADRSTANSDNSSRRQRSRAAVLA